MLVHMAWVALDCKVLVLAHKNDEDRLLAWEHKPLPLAQDAIDMANGHHTKEVDFDMLESLVEDKPW